MPAKAVYLYLLPGFADWEPAHATAELRRYGGYRVETVAESAEPVESMGGLRVLPSRTLDAVDPDDVAVLILPGGSRWEKEPLSASLRSLLLALEARGVPIAAICGATLAVARAGLLQDRKHTSNTRSYLDQHAEGYTGGAHYVDAPAVRDRGVITASGLADVEFARVLFDELGVLAEPDRALWATLFRTGRLPSTAA
jgi:putative intracellular protease/amidase